MNITMNINGNREDGHDRRSFLKYAGGLGAALVGAIAFNWADAPKAAAATNLYNVGCCTLATRTPCGGSWDRDGNFSCPSGAQKEYWGCVQSATLQYICWECKIVDGGSGSNCEVGDLEDYKCSNWYAFKAG